MKQKISDNQREWAGTTRNWYVRTDPTTMGALDRAARTKMNTMETMTLVNLATLAYELACPNTLGGYNTANDYAWANVVQKTLRVLFDPMMKDTHAQAPMAALLEKLIELAPHLYLASINMTRREAIANGTYRLQGQAAPTTGDDA